MRPDPHSARRGSASMAGLLFGMALLLVAGAIVDGERIRRNEIDLRAERIQAQEWCRAAQALPLGGSVTSGRWTVAHDRDGTCRADGPLYLLVRTTQGQEHWTRHDTISEPRP